MKSFTAKEFSRCPAKVYEAAREDGKVEITHDRFSGKFVITHDIGILSAVKEAQELGEFMAQNIGSIYPNERQQMHEILNQNLNNHLGQFIAKNKKAPD